MSEEDLTGFMPTLAQLYQEIIINELSKQVRDEFMLIMTGLLQNHKKIVVKEIVNFFAPLLFSIKFGKLLDLLFSGEEK